ncbi:MAG: alpha/beta fold hydrolase, partial [Mucilaginibacter sp.]|nr:alpha/beta fold hydrolase [Mucilaginibacter sp.]
MKTPTFKNRIKAGLVSLVLTFAAILGFTLSSQAQAVKNVVLVHGAFADGSGYKALYTELTKKGYNV